MPIQTIMPVGLTAPGQAPPPVIQIGTPPGLRCDIAAMLWANTSAAAPRHPLEVAGRLAKQLGAGYQLKKAAETEQAQKVRDNEALAALLKDYGAVPEFQPTAAGPGAGPGSENAGSTPELTYNDRINRMVESATGDPHRPPFRDALARYAEGVVSWYARTLGILAYGLIFPRHLATFLPRVDLIRHAHFGASDDAQAIRVGVVRGLGDMIRHQNTP